MYNIEMTNLEKTITNVRNILRSQGITGMDSINHCIAFIIMRYMNEEVCERYNIPQEYTYNSVLTHFKEKDMDNNDLCLLVYHPNPNTQSMYYFIRRTFNFTLEF